VACPKVDGVYKPQFMQTWNYTEKRLRSMKAYDAVVRKEKAYRRGSKYAGWKDFNGPNPHLERYGEDEWEKKLADAPAVRTGRNIKDLMDHIIAEGERMFKDTT
jgi:hypothetical protein